MPYKSTSTKPQKTSRLARLRASKIVSLAAIVVLLGAGVLVSELTNTTHFFHTAAIDRSAAKQPIKVSTTIPATKSPSASPATIASPTPSTTSTSSPSVSDKTTSSTADTSAPLVQPYGDFVSAHQYVPSNAQEQSTCNTTTGASCTISFTLGSTTKQLATETANGDGTASWPIWTADSIGLTSGSWTITAKATLGTQSSQTTDPTQLEVQ
jgi:hypothetical protein